MEKNGHFVISLDFEINWGVWDVIELEDYKEHLLGVRNVIPELIKLFNQNNITATFATVGFLFFNNKEELLNGIPNLKPAYKNPTLSPYITQLKNVGENEQLDLFHFAPTLIQQLKNSKQEIGCHTFSHYYCLEEGQTVDMFRADLQAAKKIALQWGIKLESLVFPRNQFNSHYIAVCKEEGITSYRGNENSWMYEPRSYTNESSIRRLARIIDAYINISGHHCYSNEVMKEDLLINIPSSRFLRQYKPKLAFLDWLRLNRIKASMTHAAKNNLTYHLWWHPHNFGINLKQNLAFLNKILVHYHFLNTKYGFSSVSMKQLSDKLNTDAAK